MYDLEKKVKDWEDTINFVKERIEKDKDFPIRSPYSIAKEEGEYMSLNFKIKNRDRAESFLSFMLYNNDKKELEDLLGIEITEIMFERSSDTSDINILKEVCEYCISRGIINVKDYT